MLRFCAYQERCCAELRLKLRSYGLSDSDTASLINELLEEGFVDETRYASAFARGKFRQRSWGREKIRMELEQREINSRDIELAFAEIPEEEYIARLKTLIQRKAETLADQKEFDRNGKIAKYLIGKGYEAELVWRMIKRAK